VDCTLKVGELPTNIRIGMKGLTVTNTIAYNSTEFIPAVKSFIVQVLRVNVCIDDIIGREDTEA